MLITFFLADRLSACDGRALVLSAKPQRLARKPVALLVPDGDQASACSWWRRLEHLTRTDGVGGSSGQWLEAGGDLAALKADCAKRTAKVAPSARSSSQVPLSQLPTLSQLAMSWRVSESGLSGFARSPTRSIKSVSIFVPSSSSAGPVASRHEPWPRQSRRQPARRRYPLTDSSDSAERRALESPASSARERVSPEKVIEQVVDAIQQVVEQAAESTTERTVDRPATAHSRLPSRLPAPGTAWMSK